MTTTDPGRLRVAAIQHDIVWEDPAANFEHLAPLVAGAAGAGANLVVLTEFFATGFSSNAAAQAEPPDGPTTRFLAEQAHTHHLWLCGSLPERTPGLERPTNRFTLVGPTGEVHRYSKIHPFTYAGEHQHFDAGSEVVTFDINGVRVTPFVCYDLRFADEFWSVAESTDLYIVVANWPAARRAHWQALLTARAIENQAYVVGVNRVGRGGGLDYVGDSRIVDPLGEVLASGAGGEVLLVAEVDVEHVRSVRQTFPFLQDRRRAPRRPA